jgi:hypothetical protein
MSEVLHDVFADTVFWIALVVKQDQYHEQAQKWSRRITGRITTTMPVLLEMANSLAKPNWRLHASRLIDHLDRRWMCGSWNCRRPYGSGPAICIEIGRIRRGV